MKSLMKTKSPVVGIPVEGEAPVCVDGRRLRAWARDVTIERVELEEEAKWLGDCPLRELDPRRTVTGRAIKVTGCTGQIKCSARFAVIPRGDALIAIHNWSERERERLQKKAMLGALTPEVKRAMRRAKFDEDGEGMVEVMCAMPDTPAKCQTCYGNRTAGSNCKSLGHTITEPVKKPKVLKMGTPIELGALAPLKFVVVRWGTVEDGNVSFSITETLTGKTAGSGDTAEKAILGARQRVAKMTLERQREMVDGILTGTIK